MCTLARVNVDNLKKHHYKNMHHDVLEKGILATRACKVVL